MIGALAILTARRNGKRKDNFSIGMRRALRIKTTLAVVAALSISVAKNNGSCTIA